MDGEDSMLETSTIDSDQISQVFSRSSASAQPSTTVEEETSSN